MADLPLMEAKLADANARMRELEQLRAKVEASKSKEDFFNSGELILRLISASSEAFVDMASEMADVVMPAGKATGKDKLLDGLKKMRDFAPDVGEALVGKFDKKRVAKTATNTVIGSMGVPPEANKVEKCLNGFSEATSKVMVEGIARDKQGVFTQAGKAVQGAACAATHQIIQSSEYQEGTKKVLGKAAESFNAAANIAASIRKYNQDLEKAFDDYLEKDFESQTSDRGKGTIVRMINDQRDRLRKLEKLVFDCKASLPVQPKPKTNPFPIKPGARGPQFRAGR